MGATESWDQERLLSAALKVREEPFPRQGAGLCEGRKAAGLGGEGEPGSSETRWARG